MRTGVSAAFVWTPHVTFGPPRIHYRLMGINRVASGGAETLLPTATAAKRHLSPAPSSPPAGVVVKRRCSESAAVHGGQGPVAHGLETLVGRRTSQEDRAVVSCLGGSAYLFGVFDGHGGSAVSTFLQRNAAECIQEQLVASRPEAAALSTSFRVLDEMCSGGDSGSTATCLLLTPNTIFCANCGKRGVVCTRTRSRCCACVLHGVGLRWSLRE